MKYFTMEELEEIATEILNSPSRETLKKLSDKYYGISENSNIEDHTWVEDSSQVPESIPSYEPALKPSQERNIENSTKEVRQSRVSDEITPFNVKQKNEEELINNPELEILPYNKQINEKSLDIQTSTPKTQSIIGEIEEELNRKNSELEPKKELSEEPLSEEKIDIIPYKEYAKTPDVPVEKPVMNNTVVAPTSMPNITVSPLCHMNTI